MKRNLTDNSEREDKNMVITDKLKERFCKDISLPVRIFNEPYFSDRLFLLDPFYKCFEKYEVYTKELETYRDEQAYFEEYNRIKDAAISDIKATEAYQSFNGMDMNECRIPDKYARLPEGNVYKPSNDGRNFLSIDMKKANFSALHSYDPAVFADKNTWEDFIRQYTDNEHIINSKYIRQVIMGNCNPKRQISYEKYLMSCVLEEIDRLTKLRLPEEPDITRFVKSFAADEIVFDMTAFTDCMRTVFPYESPEASCKRFLNDVHTAAKAFGIGESLKIEEYTLYALKGTEGYIKDFYGKDIMRMPQLKCVNSLNVPFITEYLLNRSISRNDKLFYHEGLLAELIEVPQISAGDTDYILRQKIRKIIDADKAEKQSDINGNMDEFEEEEEER